MFAIFIGVLLGILICQFIPPKELRVILLTKLLKACNFIGTKSKEQLERIEKENEEERDSAEN